MSPKVSDDAQFRAFPASFSDNRRKKADFPLNGWTASVGMHSRNASEYRSHMFSLIFGIAIGGTVIISANISDRMLIALCGVVFAFSLLTTFRFKPILIISIIILITPFSLDKVFMVDESHIGGAPGLIFAATDCFLLILIIQFIRQGHYSAIKSRILKTAVFLYFLGICLATVFASNIVYSLYEIIRLGKCGLLVAFVCHFVRTKCDFNKLMIAITLSVSIQAFIALCAYFLGRTSVGIAEFGESGKTVLEFLGNQEQLRASSPIGHPNGLASFIVLVSPLVWVLLNFSKGKKRFMIIGIIFILLLALALTLSRGGWIAIIVAFIVYVFLNIRYSSINRMRTTILTALVVFVCVGAMSMPLIKSRLADSPYRNVGARYDLMASAGAMIVSHPIVGIGLNNFTFVLKSYDPFHITREFESTESPYLPVHNLFLFIASETGIFGLVTWIFLVSCIVTITIRRIRSRSYWHKYWMVSILSGLVGFLAHNLVDVTYQYNTIMPFFWLFLGLMLSLTSIEANASKSN